MSTALKWGLITGMVYVVFSLVSNMLGLQQGPGGGAAKMGLGFLMIIVLLGVTFFTIFMGVKETRDQDLGGYLTLSQGFLAGFKIALIGVVISAIFSIIYFEFIDPNVMDKMISGMEEQWEESGMDEEQMESAQKVAGLFSNPYILAALGLVNGVFWGLLKSLAAGLILKKERPITMPPTMMPPAEA